MSTPTIIEIDPRKLKPSSRNARKHSKKQKRQLVDSIQQFGFNGIAVVNSDNSLLAGHLRVEVAIECGLTSIPCLRVEHLTEEQQIAFMVADNQIALNSTYDKAKLAQNFIEILQLDPSFDLTVTGFDALEIQDTIDLVEPGSDASLRAEDEVPETDENTPPVTQLGDIWHCGDHKLAQGDARRREVCEALMGSDKAQAVVTDPPFNLATNQIGGGGKAKHANFQMAAGEMREAQFEAFLLAAFLMMVEFSISGSLHYIFMDWRHTIEIGQAGRRAFTELKNICVWNKTVGSRGFYRSQHELIYVYKSGKARHIDNIGIGKGKRYRTNVWTHKGMNTGGSDRLQALEDHPTQKPARLLADAILDSTQPGGIVLDIFGGSGSTMIAAEMTGRRARLIEIDPRYCDTTVRRWQTYAKADAVHAVTGETFNAREARLVRERAAAAAEVL